MTTIKGVEGAETVTRLQGFGENLWTMEGDTVRMFGVMPFSTRMSVVRLRSGELWLHSPIWPTDARFASVCELGPVRYLVAPNKLHSLGVHRWQELVPQAETWISPEFDKRHPEIVADGVLANDAATPWGDNIEHRAIEGHAYLDEVVFLHHASKTLIVTDLIQKHDPAGESWVWRTVKRVGGVLGPKGGVPRDLRWSFRDTSAAQRSVQQILSWDFDNLILSHGFCVQGDAKDEVARCFAWLLR